MAKSPCKIPDYINYLLPEHIKYLLLPSTPLDFHAVVGDSNSGSEERIGVVKWFLIAQSKVLRVMLLESELRPEKEFKDSELDPATFRHFLVFLYGHDNTSALTFEDSVKLLSAAEKYNVTDLKCKLGKVIKSKVTPENVFIILKNGPVCEKEPSLWKKVTEILQQQTEKIFRSPQFCNATPEAVTHILQQDSLSVPEIEIWRAALKWAEHQVQNKQKMRKVTPEFLKATLRPLLKHIRICTLSYEQLGREVFPTKVFTEEEILNIFTSLNKQEKNDSLVHICNEIAVRELLNDTHTKIFESKNPIESNSLTSEILILPKNKNIKLYSVVFQCHVNQYTGYPTYQYKGNIRITTQGQPALAILFNETVEHAKECSVPLKFDGSFIELNANVQYIMKFTLETYCYFWCNNRHVIECDDCKFTLGSVHTGYRNFGSHLKTLRYKVI